MKESLRGATTDWILVSAGMTRTSALHVWHEMRNWIFKMKISEANE